MNKIREFRKAAAMTQEQLAAMLGIDTAQISRLERGTASLTVDRLRQIARALDTTPAALVDDAEGIPAPNAVAVSMEGASAKRMREDLPVFGTALGAPRIVEGEAIEQTTLNSGDIVQYVRRPVILDGRTDAYGLYVQGHSMEPVHMAGDLILAETKRPARVGDDVVVYLRPIGEEDDGDRARAVLLKRLVRRTGVYLELEQFNPARTFRIDVAEVLRVDRVPRLVDLIG